MKVVSSFFGGLSLHKVSSSYIHLLLNFVLNAVGRNNTNNILH
jgi:hypothetical protein